MSDCRHLPCPWCQTCHKPCLCGGQCCRCWWTHSAAQVRLRWHACHPCTPWTTTTHTHTHCLVSSLFQQRLQVRCSVASAKPCKWFCFRLSHPARHLKLTPRQLLPTSAMKQSNLCLQPHDTATTQQCCVKHPHPQQRQQQADYSKTSGSPQQPPAWRLQAGTARLATGVKFTHLFIARMRSAKASLSPSSSCLL